MRRIIKLGILALAVLGAQRAYELLRPRIEELRGQAGEAGSRLHEVADTARVAAEDVRQDLKAATEQVKEDLVPPVEEAKMAVADTVDTATDALADDGRVSSSS